MEFLKKNRRFSFRYGEQSAWNCAFTQEVEENSDELITIYTFEDGLKVTNIARKIPGYDAYEWINWFENTGDSPTKIISMLWDCDCEIVCDYEEDRQPTPYVPHKKEAMQIFTTQGAYNSTFDFSSRLEDYSYDFKNFIFPGMNREYKCFGGRSSDGQAPFFNIHQHNKGVIMAIGWSGQWNCRISRRKDSIQLQSKIEDTHFRLYPGEKVRTSSVVIMFYEGELVNSQNKWRRLVKEHYSLIGKRREQGPFCAMLWGGMRSEELIRRVGLIGEYQIPLDYVWVDAGWYGIDTLPTNSEFEGDWHMHTGDWTISPLIHPQAMQDVSHKIKEIGKG